MATCAYTVPDKNASGDNLYGAVTCSQAHIDYFCNACSFQARLSGGKSHNATSPAGSLFGAGKDGADSSRATKGRGCTAPCTCGGSTPPVRAPLRRCASAPPSAATSSSTTPSPRTV